MVTVEEATTIVLQNSYRPEIILIPINEAWGSVLAEPLVADRDFPPFDRVAMDGIAVRYDEWERGCRSFKIEGVQPAGSTASTLSNNLACIEVMTGAILPGNTDTVIRYEDVQVVDGTAKVQQVNVTRGQNVHRKGKDIGKGEIIAHAGCIISAAEIALVAAIGKSLVKVKSVPRFAVISTGDELVDIDQIPADHQIRRSNTYALEAALRQLKCTVRQFHLQDDPLAIEASLKKILADFDTIIISGGVSKGKFDFIPQALKNLGVKQLFHEVSQRPGKPFWFGITDQGKTVFALPGNPVSTFMCFYKFVKPWLLHSLGLPADSLQVILNSDYEFQAKLTLFLQVRVKNESGRLMAYPMAGGGSGDFANLTEVDGFIELPLEKSTFKSGELYTFIPFR